MQIKTKKKPKLIEEKAFNPGKISTDFQIGEKVRIGSKLFNCNNVKGVIVAERTQDGMYVVQLTDGFGVGSLYNILKCHIYRDVFPNL